MLHDVMQDFSLGRLAPLGLDWAAHVVFVCVFVFWIGTRYLKDGEESGRAGRLPMAETGPWWAPADSQPVENPPSRGRLAMIGLVFIFVIGTLLPVVTVALALRAPVNATAPPTIAGTGGGE